MSMSIEKENCHVCTKIVYPTERVAADEKVFHKGCFRCKTCNGVLKLGSFASMEGVFFCKPCFKKNFFSKGNYSSGFGKLTPQQEHDLKTGRVTDGNGLSTPVSPPKDFSKPPPKPETATKVAEPAKPKVEAPKVEPARPVEPAKPKEAPKAESPKPVEAAKPKVEAPKAEAPKDSKNSARSLPVAPQKESPKAAKEAPKPVEAAKPKVESPKPAEPAKPVEPAKPKAEPPKVDSPKKVESPSTSSSAAAPGGKMKKCLVCGKSVYPMEELKADDNVFHKTCFRCKKCNSVLKLGSYASMEGEVFCKTCFKKNFFSKGNYSDGFGKLTPQQEHDAKTGREPSKAFTPGSFSGMASATKSALAAETKPKPAKVEAKVEPKVETKTEPKVEPKVEAKVEPKAEPKVETKVEPKVEPKVEVKEEPKVEAKVEPKVEEQVTEQVTKEPKEEAPAEVKRESEEEDQKQPEPSDEAETKADD